MFSIEICIASWHDVGPILVSSW